MVLFPAPTFLEAFLSFVRVGCPTQFWFCCGWFLLSVGSCPGKSVESSWRLELPSPFGSRCGPCTTNVVLHFSCCGLQWVPVGPFGVLFSPSSRAHCFPLFFPTQTPILCWLLICTHPHVFWGLWGYLVTTFFFYVVHKFLILLLSCPVFKDCWGPNDYMVSLLPFSQNWRSIFLFPLWLGKLLTESLKVVFLPMNQQKV